MLSTGALKTLWEKLPAGPGRRKEHYLKKILRCSLLGQPDVEGLGVLEFRSGKPMVLFGSISSPSHEISETVTTSSLIDDVADQVFRGTIIHHDARRFTKLTVRKEGGVVFNVQDDHRGVENREDVR
jgi:hypothetical protein